MNNKLNLFYFSLLILFISSCNKNTSITPPRAFKSYPKKDIQFDRNGNIISTEIDTSDFHSSDNCILCHAEHVEEWKRSMHAYSMRDPIFFSGWKSEYSKRKNTGERFCIQCHSPVAYVTGTKLDKYLDNDKTVEELHHDLELSMSIKEGVTCTVCHSFTGVSKTVETGYDVAAEAVYHMNPGEGIMYGPLESPGEIECTEDNYCHEAEYNNLFRSSEACLPCHDFKIRGVDAEITFSEWNNVPQFAMAGLVPCQECHMPIKANGYHSHEFVGVDVDLTQSIPNSLQYESVEKLLQGSVELEFGGLIAEDTIKVENSVLSIPVTVKSLTGHSLPSGTSFAREAWLETIVKDAYTNATLFSSGTIEEPTSNLELSDSNLLLYTSFLIGENGEAVNSVTDAFGINDSHLLPALENDVHLMEYNINEIPQDFSTIDSLAISARMRFRAFKPDLLAKPDLLEGGFLDRQPVFEMARIDTTYLIP